MEHGRTKRSAEGNSLKRWDASLLGYLNHRLHRLRKTGQEQPLSRTDPFTSDSKPELCMRSLPNTSVPFTLLGSALS